MIESPKSTTVVPGAFPTAVLVVLGAATVVGAVETAAAAVVLDVLVAAVELVVLGASVVSLVLATVVLVMTLAVLVLRCTTVVAVVDLVVSLDEQAVKAVTAMPKRSAFTLRFRNTVQACRHRTTIETGS